MNIRHYKKVLLALNVVLTGLILYLGTMIFQEWKSESRPGDGPEPSVAQKSRIRVRTPGQTTRLAAYQTIVGRDIFNTTPSAEPISVELEQADIAPTQLNLRLNGTVVGDQYAYAVITDVLTNQEGIYAVNDTVQNATIAHIQTDRVVLNVSGKKEALILFPEKEDAKDKAPRTGYQAAPAKRPVVSRQGPGVRRPAFRLPSKR